MSATSKQPFLKMPLELLEEYKYILDNTSELVPIIHFINNHLLQEMNIDGFMVYDELYKVWILKTDASYLSFLSLIIYIDEQDQLKSITGVSVYSRSIMHNKNRIVNNIDALHHLHNFLHWHRKGLSDAI